MWNFAEISKILPQYGKISYHKLVNGKYNIYFSVTDEKFFTCIRFEKCKNFALRNFDEISYTCWEISRKYKISFSKFSFKTFTCKFFQLITLKFTYLPAIWIQSLCCEILAEFRRISSTCANYLQKLVYTLPKVQISPILTNSGTDKLNIFSQTCLNEKTNIEETAKYFQY
jgi:hypothetical protein